MKSIKTFAQAYYKIVPETLSRFLIKALLLFVGWSLLYDYYLQPNQILDFYLTNATTYVTSVSLKLLFIDNIVAVVNRSGHPIIRIDGRGILTILDGCNGLEVLVVYLGFFICIPSGFKLVTKFIIWGCLSIFLLNVIRCIAVAYLSSVNFRYLDSVHHYVFTIMVYSFVFFTWLLYLRYDEKHRAATVYQGNE